MKNLQARTWLLGMIAVLLLFSYLIFWVQPPEGWASRSSPSVPTLIRALQRKDSKLNGLEVAFWGRLPAFVRNYWDSFRPRLARETRRDACGRLGLLGPAATNAIPYLIKALDDPDMIVRSYAILDIRAIGPPAKSAKGCLLAMLKDVAHGSPTNQFLRMEADLVPDTLAAVAPQDPEVASGLFELLARRSATNQFSMVQFGLVAATLAAMAPRDPVVVSWLLELLAHPGPFVEPTPIARAWIQHASEPRPVFESIRKVVPQEASWDLVSCLAESYLDRRERLAMLLSLIEDPDYGIRYHAVRELGELGQLGAGAVPKLIGLFDATEKEWEDLPEPSLRVRFEAYTAFVKVMAPSRPFTGRYGPGRLAPSARVSSPVPVAAAAPPPPLRAASITAALHAYRVFGPQPPSGFVPGFLGLHYQVILALGKMGPRARDAIPLLVREYKDRTSPLRFEAAVARVQADGNLPEVMPVLAIGLEQAGPELRSTLLARIAQLAGDYDEALPLLIKALADPDPRIRAQAVHSLAPLGAKAAPALPVLIAALDDPEPGIRLQALKYLGEMGTNAAPAAPACIKVLGDADRRIRGQAVANLAALGDKALPALPALRVLASDPTFTVRIAASNAVRTIEASTNSSPRGRGSRSAP